jgi:membrane protease YdiL (CAAX protease family)
MARTPTQNDYWRESALPLTSLVFVIPILLVYEVGVFALGPAAMRNGAEQWLRQFLDWIGFGQYLLLPVLTCLALLGWQHITRQRWQFSFRTLARMVSETSLIALGLVALAVIQTSICQALQLAVPAPPSCSIDTTGAARIVGYFGAGVYEEVLFRLALIPLIAGFLRALGDSPSGSWWAAAVAASLIFSAAHYQAFTQVGDVFAWETFLFRFAAGMIFSVIFIYRGFGISAGAHTFYDVAIAFFAA